MTQGHHPMEVMPTVKGENFKKTYTFTLHDLSRGIWRCPIPFLNAGKP